MITASLHRSPTGPVEELPTALRLGQLALSDRAALAVTASSARSYGASREITITLLIMVR